MTVRLEPGVVREELDVADVGPVPVRYERCPAGWRASFDLTVPDAPALPGTHRLVASSLGEARRAVRDAVAFLLGHALGSPPTES